MTEQLFRLIIDQANIILARLINDHPDLHQWIAGGYDPNLNGKLARYNLF